MKIKTAPFLYFIAALVIIAGASYYAGYSGKSDSEELRQIKNKKEWIVDSLNMKIDQTQAKLEYSELQAARFRADLDSVHLIIKKKEASIEPLLQSIKEQKSVTSNLENSIREKNDELKKLRANSKRLKRSIQSSEAEIDELLKQREERLPQYDETYTLRQLHRMLDNRAKYLAAESDSAARFDAHPTEN